MSPVSAISHPPGKIDRVELPLIIPVAEQLP
jgi:hypothetical protein